MKLFVFKVKAIPDIDSSRRIHDLHGLSEEDVAKAVFHKRRQQTGSEVLPHHLQRIVSISAVLRTGDQFRVWSLGEPDSDESELLKRFYSGIERYQPALVSWCGNQYDLPVIRFRSLMYSLDATQFWKQESRNPLHMDLCGLLAGAFSDSTISLSEVAKLCGFPGHAELTGYDVWAHYLNDNRLLIRNNGELEVLNCYLLYLRLLSNQGQLDSKTYRQECQLVRSELENSNADHLKAFNSAWLDYRD